MAIGRPDTVRVRPVERHQASTAETLSLLTRRAGVVFMAAALVAVTSTTLSMRGGRVALLNSNIQGRDGMEVDLSTLPRSAQMQDLAHVGGTALGAAKAHYDDLLTNGPLNPNSMLRPVAMQTLAAKSSSVPSSLASGSNKSAQSASVGIGIGGAVHLLRSAREILAGKMAGELEGKPLSKAQVKSLANTRSRVPTVNSQEEKRARAMWHHRVKASLEQREVVLEEKVRKLEYAAGRAEISELSGLSERD